MSDLISRQDAIDALKRDEQYDEDIPNRADGVRDAIITISNLPSADVVEVVRCRDCEMFKLQDLNNPKHNTKWCVINGFNPQGDDYCSYGERREE